MVAMMLDLANEGVDVLRFDAVAFMWKRVGTRCQSEPEVHMLLQALRAADAHCSALGDPPRGGDRLAAGDDALSRKGEHAGKGGQPRLPQFADGAVLVGAATRETRLMTHVLASHFPRALTNATYATYLRCHDDIGWAVTDEDARAVGVDGHLHRAFLSDFYEGLFPGPSRAASSSSSTPRPGTSASPAPSPRSPGWKRAEADGDREAMRPRRRSHPDGSRADRELRRHPADLHGRRDRAR